MEKQAEKPKPKEQAKEQAKPANAEQLARGEYLVKHVMACGDCHTPRNDTGQPMADKFLAGTKHAPNLTPAKSGLGGWTAQQIKDAFMDGKEPDGGTLSEHMPYWAYHVLTPEDANAVVAYLQSIPAVESPAKEEEHAEKGEKEEHEEHEEAEKPAQPLTLAMMPETSLKPSDPNYKAAQNGKYLAIIGGCTDCHTEPSKGAVPVDTKKLLAGGRKFTGMLPSPPFPKTIVSSNLTPDANGLKGWTVDQVKQALKQGVDDEGEGICPPMPSGPHGPYGGMTDEDAMALGYYLTTIPATDNGKLPHCEMPEKKGEQGEKGEQKKEGQENEAGE